MGLEGRGLSDGGLRMRSRTFGFLKMRGVPWLAADLLAFRQGLFSLELVNIRMGMLSLVSCSIGEYVGTQAYLLEWQRKIKKYGNL